MAIVVLVAWPTMRPPGKLPESMPMAPSVKRGRMSCGSKLGWADRTISLSRRCTRSLVLVQPQAGAWVESTPSVKGRRLVSRTASWLSNPPAHR